MSVLDKEYEVLDRIKDRLEANHYLEWVVIHDDELVGTFHTFQEAATVAVSRFGRGPYLITQVGEPLFTLPASVQHRPVYDQV